MKQLDYAWRLFGTALGFSVFGLAGLVIGLLILPILFLLIRDNHSRHVTVRKLIGKAFGAFVWMINCLGVLSYEIQGKENIISGHRQLIIANHPTLLDVVFLISMFPQAICVIKKAVTQNPFMRSTVAAANYIWNSEEPEEFIDSCVERIMSGGSLLLFPEGTRSIVGEPPNFKLGAATVAVRTGVEVLPIIIDCVPRFLGKNDSWYKITLDRPHFTIRIVPPSVLNQIISSDQNQRQNRHSLNEALISLYTRELSG